MPDFGIGEAIAGLADVFTRGDLLAGLFGGGAAAETAAPAIGAAELAGPTFAGTVFDTLGQGAFHALSGSALAGTGANVLSAGSHPRSRSPRSTTRRTHRSADAARPRSP